MGGNKPELYGRDGIEIEALINFKIYSFLYAKTGIGYNEQGGEIRYNDLVHPIRYYVTLSSSSCFSRDPFVEVK